MSSFFISILEQGLIFAIVSLGVYITYKILDFPDLSVDGTFPLGAAIVAIFLSKGMNPFLASILAMFGGMIGGAITGILNVKFKINNLLSGIIVMTGLYSINLRIMEKSNIPFFGFQTIFTYTEFIKPVALIVIIIILVKTGLDLFLKTKLGFVLKAVGDNEQLVTALGVNKDFVKIIGLSISNGLVALGGAIMAQDQGFADVGMGTGTVIIGLAAVILGGCLFEKLSFIKVTTMTILGAILYKLFIGLALKLGLKPTDLKLITSLIVVGILGANNLKFSFGKFNKKTSRGDEFIASNTKSM